MKSKWLHRDLISINDLSKEDMQAVFDLAKKFKEESHPSLLKNKIVANCFFEPSTRTRLSFETAAYRLGAKILGFDSQESASIKKGEDLQDTIKVVSSYADLIIVRHPQEGAARLASKVSDKPVINAGDGANQHPSQALIDLFSMQECQGSLDGLSIALVGDLKYGRTIHSLAHACAYYDIRLFLVSPSSLALPSDITDKLKVNGVRYSFHSSLEEVIPKVDIIYMTRLQQERLSIGDININMQPYHLTISMLNQAKPKLKVFHPLPRLNEIDRLIDGTPYAYYFEQAKNGVYIRQALLAMLLGDDHE